jgi:hypothetical protein
MDTLINFFSLRPMFTFVGLKAVWYIYLLHMFFQIYVSYSEVAQLLAQRGVSWLTWIPNSPPIILGIVSQVILVRLLLEVAATILLTKPRNGM